MNTPGPITAGFFDAVGRIVMKLPGVTSYVPASLTNGPHAARNSSALAFATSDRIGRGPWQNVKGVVVAQNVDDLHSDNNKLSKENSITEKGATVNGRGDTPNTHDILTGSGLDGRLPMGATNCNNWTSNAAGAANVGHHGRGGGGRNPNSWNAAHATNGCSQANLVATGGAGLFYCFAQ